MADTVTSVYQFTLPEVGASDDTWGTKLNADLSKLETLFSNYFGGGGPTTLGTYWKANQAIQFAGAKNIQVKNASGQQEGAFGIDADAGAAGATGNVFLQKLNPTTAAALARLRLEPDGAINAHVGFFKGSGSGLTGIPYSAIDFSTPGAGIFTSLSINNNGNKSLYFREAAGSPNRALIYSVSSDDSLLMQAYAADGTSVGARMRLYPDGNIEWIGEHQGIIFDNATGSNAQDLSKHIDLYGGVYGINVTGSRLNFNMNASAYADFYSGSTLVARIDTNNDTGLDADQTVVTRIKGDQRYRNASNLNAGTVPVAQLPTSSTERSRILALLAGSTPNTVGTYAFLRRIATSITWNADYTGSTLYASGGEQNGGAADVADSTRTMSGTWTAFGEVTHADDACATLFLKIA